MKTEVFNKMFLPKFGAFLLTLLSCQLALAATVSQEREELSSLRRDLAKQEEKLKTLKSEEQSLPDTIAKVQAEAAKTEAEFKAEQTQFYKLKSDHAAAPTDTTERQLRLGEIKFGLAERRHNNAATELNNLQDKQNQLQSSLDSTENAINASRTKIVRQERRLADAIALAEQQEVEKTRAVTKPEPPKVAITAPVIEAPKAEIKVEEPAPVAATPAPAETRIELSEKAFEEFQFAKEKMAATNDLIAAAGANDNANQDQLHLNGPNFNGIPFNYLGNQQYRADVTLHTGRHTFEIEKLRFRVDVPESDDAQVYVFLVDARDKNQLRASYFRQELLSYVDKEVVLKKPAAAIAASTGVIETADGILMSKDDYKEFQFATEKMASTESLAAAAAVGDQPSIVDLQLTNADLGNTPFRYLGNQQYRADLALTSGRHNFRVDSLRFNFVVPDATAAQDYIFLVDAREKGQLRVSYFRKVLLEYADKKVAIAP
jgi:predicted  nucleic acid-binding Zn-ribbon protein